MLTFEQRQGSAGFWATLIGALYALTLPLALHTIVVRVLQVPVLYGGTPTIIPYHTYCFLRIHITFTPRPDVPWNGNSGWHQA